MSIPVGSWNSIRIQESDHGNANRKSSGADPSGLTQERGSRWRHAGSAFGMALREVMAEIQMLKFKLGHPIRGEICFFVQSHRNRERGIAKSFKIFLPRTPAFPFWNSLGFFLAIFHDFPSPGRTIYFFVFCAERTSGCQSLAGLSVRRKDPAAA